MLTCTITYTFDLDLEEICFLMMIEVNWLLEPKKTGLYKLLLVDVGLGIDLKIPVHY